MNTLFKNTILQSTNATDFHEIETIQNLWSGYGRIVRLSLEGSDIGTVVIKHVQLPLQTNHPRGWDGEVSHQRKIKSYQVETVFYKDYSSKCNSSNRIPKCLAYESFEDEVLIVLEDLDICGYPIRRSTVDWQDVKGCIGWLANFHATFMNVEPKELWEVGTYWHLATRPDELGILTDLELKNAASTIDSILNTCTYKTFVHGDAKLANFCFSETKGEVSALDFQYVGGGCGMKDLAYFIGSCYHEAECEKYETKILDYYFQELKAALKDTGVNFDNLEKEWRQLFPVAWTDFHRFLKGWSPGHWKINSYSERVAKEVIKGLK